MILIWLLVSLVLAGMVAGLGSIPTFRGLWGQLRRVPARAHSPVAEPRRAACDATAYRNDFLPPPGAGIRRGLPPRPRE